MTLKFAINEFIGNITVTDKQEESIDASYNNLCKHLTNEESNLSVKEVFLNGSYVRDTMIKPLDDIDVFAVIDKDDYNDNGTRPNPQTVLTKFKNYLNGLNDYKDKVSQSRPCVTITLSKIHIDVLPALREHDSLYIPNESLSGWILTDPKTHTQNIETASKNSSGMIKDVIKAVKSWKKDHEYKIPSFHVEEVAINIFNAYSYQSVEEGIRKWFTKAKYYISQDRFNSDTQYDDTIDAVKEVAKQLEEARRKDDDKKTSEAIRIWHDIFGPQFPTISKDEAKDIGAKLSEGTLRYSATAGLSTCAGRVMGASKGFYGEE